jgi:hypothetical protein
MNAVLPNFGDRIAAALYSDVMNVACELRDLLRVEHSFRGMQSDDCLSYVRATGSMTSQVIGLVCWACAYRALHNNELDLTPFLSLSEELRQATPHEAGVASPDDFFCLQGLPSLQARVNVLCQRIDRLQELERTTED